MTSARTIALALAPLSLLLAQAGQPPADEPQPPGPRDPDMPRTEQVDHSSPEMSPVPRSSEPIARPNSGPCRFNERRTDDCPP